MSGFVQAEGVDRQLVLSLGKPDQVGRPGDHDGPLRAWRPGGGTTPRPAGSILIDIVIINQGFMNIMTNTYL